jgi:hypothetical protein
MKKIQVNSDTEFLNIIESLKREVKKTKNHFINKKDDSFYFVFEDRLYGICKVGYTEVNFKCNLMVWEDLADFEIVSAGNKKTRLEKRPSFDYIYMEYDDVVELYANINLMNIMNNL